MSGTYSYRPPPSLGPQPRLQDAAPRADTALQSTDVAIGADAVPPGVVARLERAEAIGAVHTWRLAVAQLVQVHRRGEQ
eukprot:11919108-Alexandrium_andersonii.AAC.1